MVKNGRTKEKVPSVDPSDLGLKVRLRCTSTGFGSEGMLLGGFTEGWRVCKYYYYCMVRLSCHLFLRALRPS